MKGKKKTINAKVFAAYTLTLSIWGVLIVRVLIEPSTTGRLINVGLLAFVVVFGVFLIRSVLNEVRQKEQLKEVTSKLQDLKENLEERVEEQTKEVKKAYHVERKAREELEALDKAKDQFIFTTQHHLRTPLTIIKGYLNMIHEVSEGKLNPKAQKSFEEITKAEEDLSRATNKLLFGSEKGLQDK